MSIQSLIESAEENKEDIASYLELLTQCKESSLLFKLDVYDVPLVLSTGSDQTSASKHASCPDCEQDFLMVLTLHIQSSSACQMPMHMLYFLRKRKRENTDSPSSVIACVLRIGNLSMSSLSGKVRKLCA